MPIEPIVKVLFIFAVMVMGLAPIITWIERKQSAVMQDRIGANRADINGITILGLLHPAADVIKLFTKEDVVPAGANRVMHLLSPLIAAVPAIIAFAVIPYGGVYQFGDTTLNLVGADIDWGLLYIFAIGSIASYGTVLAGWSSNNNWSLLGGVRSAAQMISYEVTLGLSIVGVFMVFGTLKLTDMAVAQAIEVQRARQLVLQAAGRVDGLILQIERLVREGRQLHLDQVCVGRAVEIRVDLLHRLAHPGAIHDGH